MNAGQTNHVSANMNVAFHVGLEGGKVKDPVIKILAAKMHITSRGLHLEDVKPVSSFVIRARCQRSP